MVIFDPFVRLDRTGGTFAAGAAVVGGLAASRLGVRFDGFLDMHVGGPTVPLGTAVADQMVAVALGVVVAWVVARLFRAQASATDLFVAIGVARLPTVATAPLFALLVPSTLGVGDAVQPSLGVVVTGVGALGVLAWHVTLLVFGVRYAMGLRGGRLAGAVMTLILTAELLSKIALAFL